MVRRGGAHRAREGGKWGAGQGRYRVHHRVTARGMGCRADTGCKVGLGGGIVRGGGGGAAWLGTGCPWGGEGVQGGQEPGPAQVELGFIHIPQHTQVRGGRTPGGAQPLWQRGGHPQPQGTAPAPRITCPPCKSQPAASRSEQGPPTVCTQAPPSRPRPPPPRHHRPQQPLPPRGCWAPRQGGLLAQHRQPGGGDTPGGVSAALGPCATGRGDAPPPRTLGKGAGGAWGGAWREKQTSEGNRGKEPVARGGRGFTWHRAGQDPGGA